RPGEVVDVFLAVEHGHDLIYMLIQQQVVISALLEQPAGVDELDVGIGLVLGQHQDVHRDGGAVEQVGRQRYHGFDVVVIHQILADFLLGTAPVKDAGEADDGGAPPAGKVAERVQHKGKVGLRLGREHPGRGKALVVDQRRVVA